MLFLESLILCFNFSGYCVVKCGSPFNMITKTCRFAVRRARPTSYKGGYLGEMCAPSYLYCNNTLRNNNILSKFYVHLTSKRSPARNCRAISGPRCQMQSGLSTARYS